MVRGQTGGKTMAKKVLVVDDDESAVKFVSTILSEHGYEPLVAYDGREGMEKLQETEVDLVVLDVMMPKKTGFVLFRQLKKDEKLRDIPVLMLTGVAASLADLDSRADDTMESPYDSLRESLRKTIKEMREEGDIKPEMFVDKPVVPEAFIEKVRELIGQ
jgi:two-component system alkaline phosphatase synthesis response regulator PhoP